MINVCGGRGVEAREKVEGQRWCSLMVRFSWDCACVFYYLGHWVSTIPPWPCRGIPWKARTPTRGYAYS